MKIFARLMFIVALGFALFLVTGGCGPTAGGGIGGTGISAGSIKSFGSLFVNGIEFDTSEALL